MKLTPKKKSLLLTLLLAVTTPIALLMAGISDALTVPRYQISRADFPQLKIDKPLKFALITDLHSCFYGEGQAEIFDVLQREQPDAVLLVGDIYDDKLPPKHTDALLSRFKNTFNAYYVSGNHELYLPPEQYAELERRMAGYGIKMMHGREATLPGSNVHLFGVTDPVREADYRRDLVSTGTAAQADNFNILLSHRPELIHEYQQYPFHLIVSGHAHGGQWRIPFLLNGLIAPEGFFPKYGGGEYRFDNSRLIVSRGLARESTPNVPRVYNKTEVVMIELKP